MKLIHAIRASMLAFGLVLGAPASGPAIAASNPVIFLSNAEPVSLDSQPEEDGAPVEALVQGRTL